MSRSRWSSVLLTGLGLVAVVAGASCPLGAEEKPIKIGLLFDFTGPFSAAGSLLNYRGAKLAIDWANDHGGVLGKHKIIRVDSDAQSKAEVAINEAERLLNVEKVDILAGIFSSAHAVPVSERVDRQKRFLWITTAISDAVFKDRNLQYTFRPQAAGSMFGALSVQYVAAFAPEKLKQAPKDLRVAIIYEDGPYGAGVATFDEIETKKQVMQVVVKEGYSVHGAGHSQLDKLKEAFGHEVEGFHTIDPIAADLIDAKKLKPGVGEMTQEMVRRYRKEFGEPPPLHVSIGFNNMWILLSDVLPRAIQQHGGWTPDALAAAARETDIPEGGTMQGYGVKFFPPGSSMAGQNERAFPAVYQVQDGKFALVYPKTFASTAPVLPFPASSPFAAR